MNIWAIADLHLCFGVPEKTMEIFGPQWHDYAGKIERAWRSQIKAEDLILIAGDISWAKTLDEALIDLKWIDALPGLKVMIRGNHDYWWGSLSKVRQSLPPSIHVIQNDAFNYQNISIGGARLWDTSEYHFGFREPLNEEELKQQEKIFHREVERLELSLKCLKKEASLRIAMTHYPPIGGDLKPSKVSTLLEKYGVSHCVFGHLHNMAPNIPLFGQMGPISYHLTSCDYLNFMPLKIV
jgi:predicted phosphohydrolase